MKKIYFDYNATTPVDKRVLDEMIPYYQEDFGNPSSIHSFGNRAKAVLDSSREKIAQIINVKANEIVFTNGGSEGNNYIIKGLARALKHKGNHIISSSVEHASTLETLGYLETEGFDVTYLPVDSNGVVDMNVLSESITKNTIFVTCIFANNETGVVSPVNEIGNVARDKGIPFHTDAVQALGKMNIDFSILPVDAASFSSHKIYGPKGVGAVYLKKGLNPVSLLHGGGQERGRRSGTENVPGIAGFGKACELLNSALEEEIAESRRLTEILTNNVVENIKDVSINGIGTERLSNTLNLCIDGVEGESLVINLDLEGVAASTGSACSEGNVEPSHVLLAMGLSRDRAVSSLRLSLGRFSTDEDVEKISGILPGIVDRIRSTEI